MPGNKAVWKKEGIISKWHWNNVKEFPMANAEIFLAIN